MPEIREPLHFVLPILPHSRLRKENPTLRVATTRGNDPIRSTSQSPEHTKNKDRTTNRSPTTRQGCIQSDCKLNYRRFDQIFYKNERGT